MFLILHLKGHRALKHQSQLIRVEAELVLTETGTENAPTSTSKSCFLGLWMRKAKVSSHTGSLVLYLVWRRKREEERVMEKTMKQHNVVPH